MEEYGYEDLYGTVKRPKEVEEDVLKDIVVRKAKFIYDTREEILKNTKQEIDNLFITKDGNPANADRLRDWIGDWGDVVEQPIYPHSLRHYQISLLKRLEIDDDLSLWGRWLEFAAEQAEIYYDTLDDIFDDYLK